MVIRIFNFFCNLFFEIEFCVNLFFDKINEEVDMSLKILYKIIVENLFGVKIFKSFLSFVEWWWCVMFRKLFGVVVVCSGGFLVFVCVCGLGVFENVFLIYDLLGSCFCSGNN